MDSDRVLNVVTDFLERKGKLPEDKTELLNYRYLDVGHIDSFGMVQLLMLVEEEFDIELKQENMENLEFISTIGGIVELAAQRIKEGHEGKIREV
jgi:acyl carrier protein